MIRLADAVAGFSRDQIEGGDYVKDLGIHHSAGVDHEVERLVGPAAVAATPLESSHGPIAGWHK